MRFSTVSVLPFLVSVGSAAAVEGIVARESQVADSVSSVELVERQSTAWVDNCRPGTQAPSDWKAFDVGGCNAQLTFTKDRRNVGIQWEFEAFYANGARQIFTPFRNFDSFAVSDTFYSVDLGNNWISNAAESNRYTSVHEFSNVCRNGAAPTSWTITARADNTACQPRNYRYTSPRINVARGTRPANTRPSARRVTDNGEWEITWPAVPGAAAYTVMFKVPLSNDETGNPYTRVIGRRVQAPATRVDRQQGIIRQRYEGRSRQVAVNVVNSQGVWSFTPESPIVEAPW